jgi:putative spermidine/putrescine transport system ATP-binding protein
VTSVVKKDGGTSAVGVSGAAAVRLMHITHRFGDVMALNDVSLEVWPGEFVTLLGPSGSGKSTLLRIIAGLTAPSAGQVFIAGEDVSLMPTQRRGVGFVFQNYALFPHLSVFENIAYPLRIRGVKAPALGHRVDQALARVNLHELGHRQPAQLSGGQQQRVAVARALVYEPAVLLMDEPLGALDRKLRKHMQLELRQLQQDLQISCIYVTHDQEEALTMSDRIAVMQ